MSRWAVRALRDSRVHIRRHDGCEHGHEQEAEPSLAIWSGEEGGAASNRSLSTSVAVLRFSEFAPLPTRDRPTPPHASNRLHRSAAHPDLLLALLEVDIMTILYALVARGTVVLAEFSAASGNASTIARRILEKIPAGGDSRVSYSQDRHIFHIMKADGLTFLCMASDTFGRRIPFAYLEDIHMRFMKNYGKVANTALAYAMNDEFSRVLHQQMEYFSSNPNADTINRVKGEIAEVRAVMVENIDKVLERGDRIELLVDKTSTIQDNTFRFKKQSRRLRQAMWMKNAKLLATLTCLIVVLLYIIISFFCGGIFLHGCRG